MYKNKCIDNRKNKSVIRNSSIELLKIIGIFLIIISHVTQTLCTENIFINYHNYILDLSTATTNIQHLILSIMRYFGVIGNTIFFVCTAWFLLDSKKVNSKKWFITLFEVWVVSIIILIADNIIRSGDIDRLILRQSLLPTTFSANWYMTCYLLFYPIHPYLNKIITSMDQKQLFRSTIVLVTLYIIFSFININLFFSTTFMLWVTIYFVIAYMKIYLPKISSNKKANLVIFCLGLLGFIGIILATNFLGLRTTYYSNKLLYWLNNCNPFIIIFVIALFNLARTSNFKSKFINSISKLSLIIYLFHENIIIRTYYRPYAMNYIYEHFGYDYIFLWVILLSIIIFIMSIIVGLLYEVVLSKLVKKICDKLYNLFSNNWSKFEQKVFKLH